MIDFLDSFFDSWFMDAGTLLQDVQVMWSYRFQRSVNMNTVLRLIVFRDILLDWIRQVDPVYEREVYYVFSCRNWCEFFHIPKTSLHMIF